VGALCVFGTAVTGARGDGGDAVAREEVVAGSWVGSGADGGEAVRAAGGKTVASLDTVGAG
jgi:hypothetical protein